jgi:UDP-GlcNAc:undecaprenyl-phosphate GlcNAc-1-phosphate transferase
LLIGLINSILVIKFINIAASPTVPFPMEAAPAIGFAILIVPLFDTLRVFALRIFNRRSPFSPDRNHVHHFLLELGFSHRKVTLLCVSCNIGLLLIAYFLRSFGTTIVIGVLMAMSCTFIAIIYYSRPKNKVTEVVNIDTKKQVVQYRKIATVVSKSVEAN